MTVRGIYKTGFNCVSVKIFLAQNKVFLSDLMPNASVYFGFYAQNEFDIWQW